MKKRPPKEAWRFQLTDERSTFTALALHVDDLDRHVNAVCVAGFFKGEVSFGPTKLVSKGTGFHPSDGVVACFDTLGKVQWVHALSSEGMDTLDDIAIDHEGDVFVVGAFGGTDDGRDGVHAELAGTKIEMVGKNRTAVARFDKTGKLKWARAVDGKGSIATRTIALASGDRFALGGKFYDEVEIAGRTFRSQSYGGGLVAMFDAFGKATWAVPFIAEESASVEHLVFFNDTVHAVGYFKPRLTIGDKHELESAGDQDAFVAALGPGGEHAWSRAHGGTGTDAFYTAARDSVDGLDVGGAFGGTMENKTARGDTDGFVGDLGRDGALVSFAPIGGDGRDDIRGIARMNRMEMGTYAVAVGVVGENFKYESVAEVPVPVTVVGKMQGAIFGFQADNKWVHPMPSPNGLGTMNGVEGHKDTLYASGTVDGKAVLVRLDL